MGNRMPGLSSEVVANLSYRDKPLLDSPVTFDDNYSKTSAKIARQFYAKIWEVRHVSWNRGGAFFHELFDFYKRYPKLQVEFLAQTMMQITNNPCQQYAFQLHWVLMEFLFHGRNHVLINATLCEFYERVITSAKKQIKEIERQANLALGYNGSQTQTQNATTVTAMDSGPEGTLTMLPTTLKNSDSNTGIESSNDSLSGPSVVTQTTAIPGGPGPESSSESQSEFNNNVVTGAMSSDSGTSNGEQVKNGNFDASIAAGRGSGDSNGNEKNDAISDLSLMSTNSSLSGSTAKSSSSSSSNSDRYYPYRVKATAEYTLTNLRDIIDYSSRNTCVGGTPKWLVVEYHDSAGKVSYHRKVIRYKLYERRARYVDTVASEFGFPDPEKSELFVVYTDSRKTSYRVNYGADMLRPDEELKYDLDWTDCYFIYKSLETPLRNNFGNIVDIPVHNGHVFFLCDLPGLANKGSNGHEGTANENNNNNSSMNSFDQNNSNGNNNSNQNRRRASSKRTSRKSSLHQRQSTANMSTTTLGSDNSSSNNSISNTNLSSIVSESSSLDINNSQSHFDTNKNIVTKSQCDDPNESSMNSATEDDNAVLLFQGSRVH